VGCRDKICFVSWFELLSDFLNLFYKSKNIRDCQHLLVQGGSFFLAYVSTM